jgi:hypothetical protein
LAILPLSLKLKAPTARVNITSKGNQGEGSLSSLGDYRTYASRVTDSRTLNFRVSDQSHLYGCTNHSYQVIKKQKRQGKAKQSKQQLPFLSPTTNCYFFSISSTSLRNLHKIASTTFDPLEGTSSSPLSGYFAPWCVLTFALARSQPNPARLPLCVCATPGIRCKVPYPASPQRVQVQVPPLHFNGAAATATTLCLSVLHLAALPVPGLAVNRGTVPTLLYCTATAVAYLASHQTSDWIEIR